MKIINEGRISDFARKVNSTAKNVVDDVENTLDYYKGKRDSKFDYKSKANDSDLEKTALGADSKGLKYQAKKDDRHNMVQVQFDVREVPRSLADRVNPTKKSQDSLVQYITSYDEDSYTVTMELPMSGNKDKDESVMAPTPVPYKGQVCDKDGILIPKDSAKVDDEEQESSLVLKEESQVDSDEFYSELKLELDTSEESDEVLDETAGLELSIPEVVTDPVKGDFLEIKINNKVYRYELSDSSDKTVSDVARTVTGIQKHSDGRALAYLKKNMKLVKTTIEESMQDASSEEIISAVTEQYGTTDQPYKGPSFILPNGDYLDVEGKIKNHSDVEKWLVEQGLSPYTDIGRTQGSPSLKSSGCIRVDTVKYYVQLPYDNITSSQYSALKDWVDFLMTCNVPFMEITAPDVSPVKYRFDGDIDAEYITERVRRYYVSGTLYENIKESSSFKDHHICQGCGKPLSQCTCEVQEEDIDFDNLVEEQVFHLGDEVSWKGDSYVIIDDKDQDQIRLRPSSKMKDLDFDDVEAGDASEDIYLAQFQLKECTQPSSIGQYKTDSIDIIEGCGNEEEGTNE